MNGRRVDARIGDDDRYPYPILEPGEYGKGLSSIWYCLPPGLPKHAVGTLSAHQICVHEDATITVSPSIEIKYTAPDGQRAVWHGFLERGVWREA
jgi:hypothetical protein